MSTTVLTGGSDALLTARMLWQGMGDPQMRLEGRSASRSMRLPSGPATIHLKVDGATVVAQAWGPGAAEALERVPALIGERDDADQLIARHPIVATLQRRLAGLRLSSGTPLIETLLPAIIGQKITAFEARRSWRAFIRQHGEVAPGPLGLMLPPPPVKLARLPYWAFHAAGIERRRAETMRAAAAVADRLETFVALDSDERMRRLMSLPGIGPWTAAKGLRLAYGDPDAVSVGDYHLPRLVCRVLAGEEDGDDARMLELLEPYRGQRARVVLLIEHAGLRPERHGPRMSARSIADI